MKDSEEIAFNNDWIDIIKLQEIAKSLGKSSYGRYLNSLLVV